MRIKKYPLLQDVKEGTFSTFYLPIPTYVLSPGITTGVFRTLSFDDPLL
jgi:hypothetical protein